MKIKTNNMAMIQLDPDANKSTAIFSGRSRNAHNPNKGNEAMKK
jgi:hypothetical protein